MKLITFIQEESGHLTRLRLIDLEAEKLCSRLGMDHSVSMTRGGLNMCTMKVIRTAGRSYAQIARLVAKKLAFERRMSGKWKDRIFRAEIGSGAWELSLVAIVWLLYSSEIVFRPLRGMQTIRFADHDLDELLNASLRYAIVGDAWLHEYVRLSLLAKPSPCSSGSLYRQEPSRLPMQALPGCLVR